MIDEIFFEANVWLRSIIIVFCKKRASIDMSCYLKFKYEYQILTEFIHNFKPHLIEQ
jgi:hypothetical protein